MKFLNIRYMKRKKEINKEYCEDYRWKWIYENEYMKTKKIVKIIDVSDKTS